MPNYGYQPAFTLLAEINLGAVSADDLALSVVLPSGILSVAYTGRLIASGGTPPYTYAISSGSLPTGLSLDTGTGEITGTPTVAGYYEFTAAVTDTAPDTVSKVVSITVASGIAVAGSFAPGEVGIAYSSGLSASGGAPPYTWTVASGTLPTSTSISSGTGIVSGTPSADGTFNVTIRATDTNADFQDFPTSIVIAPAVALSGIAPDGLVGVAYSFAPTTTGGVAPFSYTVSSGSIPVGCSFSSASGTVFGTPSVAATYSFDITVLDVLGGTDTLSNTVEITTAGGITGNFLESINNLPGDSGGNISLVSHDGSVHIVPTSHGDIDFYVTFPASGQTALQFKDEGSNLGASGTATSVDFVGAAVTATRSVNAITVTVSAQAPIQFKDEGSNLGTSGTPTSFDVVGGGATLTRVSDALTLTVSGGTSTIQAAAVTGGTGEDGNCDLDGVNTFPWCTLAGSVYTQTRNCAVARLRISTGVTLQPSAFHVWIQQWDCTTGFYGFIDGHASADGNNASGATAGVAGTRAWSTTRYFATSPIAPTNGGSGPVGAGTSSTSTTTNSNSFGGSGTRGALGGNGTSGSGAQGGTCGAFSGYFPISNPYAFLFQIDNSAPLTGGGPGTGGGTGAGDGTNTAGGGGGGGAGGPGIDLSIGEIITDGSTPARMVDCRGGNGGNGGNRTVGNVGGGGGGGAGGGGYIRCLLGFHTGPSVVGFFDCSGGNGGNGGTKAGTGTNGSGANGGDSGRIMFINAITGVATAGVQASGSAASGTTGGTGGQCKVTLT